MDWQGCGALDAYMCVYGRDFSSLNDDAEVLVMCIDSVSRPNENRVVQKEAFAGPFLSRNHTSELNALVLSGSASNAGASGKRPLNHDVVSQIHLRERR
jgi:hypothetical protein